MSFSVAVVHQMKLHRSQPPDAQEEISVYSIVFYNLHCTLFFDFCCFFCVQNIANIHNTFLYLSKYVFIHSVAGKIIDTIEHTSDEDIECN